MPGGRSQGTGALLRELLDRLAPQTQGTSEQSGPGPTWSAPRQSAVGAQVPLPGRADEPAASRRAPAASRAHPTNLSAATDEQLMALCCGPSAAAREEAFRELLARYRRASLALAYQMLGNREDAEDAAQESFVRAFEALPRFRGQAAFSTWLYRIVTNTCLGRLRQRREALALDSLAERTAPDDPSQQVADGMLARQVLARMPPHLQTVLLLRVEGGLSYQEISRALHIPVGTVRSRLSEARSLFRRLWEEAAEVGRGLPPTGPRPQGGRQP